MDSSADARWGGFSHDKEFGSGPEIELAGGVEGREPEIGPAGTDSTWLEIEPAGETLGRLLLEKSILFVQENGDSPISTAANPNPLVNQNCEDRHF